MGGLSSKLLLLLSLLLLLEELVKLCLGQLGNSSSASGSLTCRARGNRQGSSEPLLLLLGKLLLLGSKLLLLLGKLLLLGNELLLLLRSKLLLLLRNKLLGSRLLLEGSLEMSRKGVDLSILVVITREPVQTNVLNS